jgi:hypothetical protein
MRAGLTYFRVLQTVVFVKGLVMNFVATDLIPLAVMMGVPLLYFFTNSLFDSRCRKEYHKLVMAFFITRFIGFPLSIAVLSLVLKNIGSFAWGLSHGNTGKEAKQEVPVTEDLAVDSVKVLMEDEEELLIQEGSDIQTAIETIESENGDSVVHSAGTPRSDDTEIEIDVSTTSMNSQTLLDIPNV